MALEGKLALSGGNVGGVLEEGDDSPVIAINQPLLEAYNAMWDAGRALEQGDPRAAIPHMRLALAAIERAGWQRLLELGAPPIERVISLGGGARNPQWRRIREQCLGMPVANRPNLSAAAGVARLALAALGPGPGARMGADPLAPATPAP